MNITIFTSSISRKAGGVMNAMKSLYLSDELKEYNIKIYAQKDSFALEDKKKWLNTNIFLYNCNNFFGYSRIVRNKIITESGDLLHIHGLWMYPQAFINTWKSIIQKPVLVTPHGMLDPYIIQNQSKIKRILGKILFTEKSFKNTDCLHALCKKEMEDIRAYGLTQPIAVIPNGVSVNQNWHRTSKKEKTKHILYIGRLHKKKGIDLLLKALDLINIEDRELLKDCIIDIVGWDHENCLRELITIAKNSTIQDKIIFHGPLYGENKINILKKADVFILPSHGEGLPMTVLEAWAWELPVIITPQCNLPEAYDYKAGIKIEDNIESVKDGIIKFLNMTENEQLTIGKNGRILVEKEFSCSAVAKKMAQLYNWLTNKEKKSKPNFVYF